MIMKLTFGVFAQVLRLCKKRGVTDTQLVGSMTRTVDPTCGYYLRENKDTVSAILRCERNLSPGNIEESGSGATRRPSESISNVVQAAQGADFDAVSSAFVTKVVRLLDENKKQNAVLALLDIIRQDESLDDESFDGMKLNFDKCTRTTKKALLTQDTFILSGFLAGLFLYTASFGLQNTEGKDTVLLITSEYVRSQSYEGLLTIFDAKDSPRPINPRLSKAQMSRRVTPQTQPAFYTYLIRLKDNNDRIKTLFYNDQPRPFYDFYVCNDITPMHNLEMSNELPSDLESLLLEERRHSRTTIHSVDITKLSEVSRFIIVTGTGGLGKSMMMRHLLLSTINNYEQNPLVPVLVLLKDYDKGATDLFEFSYSIISNLDSNITREDYIAALKSGSCLILLDGLDEVSTILADTFERELQKFTVSYPDNHFVISSRAYQNFVSFNAFTILRMLPFNKEQAVALIDKLEYRPDNPSIKQKFQKELDERLCETHPSFIRNPLLLTIMLMTFARYAEVPSKMHVFYKEAYDALASMHDASKGAYKRSFKTGLTPDIFADYLAEICFRSYRQEKFEFTEQEFYQIFDSLTIKNDSVNPDDFLYDLCFCLCLMYHEGDKYYFQHRSFQEYFSAVFLSRQKDEFIRRLGPFFEDHVRRAGSDQTFDMLRDMIPEKIDSFIIIPFLQALLQHLEENGGYLAYLNEMYPRFKMSVGETLFERNFLIYPASFLHKYVIMDMLGRGFFSPSDYLDYTSLPENEEFLANTFVKIKGRSGRDEIYPREVLRGRELESVDGEPAEEVGRLYFFDIRKIIKNPKKYPDIIEVLENDRFVHKAEYEKLKEYLKYLMESQKSTDDSLLDLL